MQNDKQKLIDIMFEVALTIHNNPWFKDKDNETVCKWIRKELK